MRLHVSSKIIYAHIYAAKKYAEEKSNTGSVFLIKCDEHGSRSADHAYEVVLGGDGSVQRHKRNSGTYGANGGWNADYAAHWDAWGWFFAYLFRVDPNMHTWADKNVAAFNERTNNQFVIAPIDYTARSAS